MITWPIARIRSSDSPLSQLSPRSQGPHCNCIVPKLLSFMAQMEMSATRDESFKTPGPALSAAY